MKKYQQWKSVLLVFLLLSSAMAFAMPGDDDCPEPEGIQVSEVSATSARITWSPADGGSSYEVNVENADGNPVFYNYERTISGLTTTINGLQGGSSYKVKVRTNCGDDHSDWSDRVVFSTSGSGSGGTGGTGGTGGGSCAVPGGLTISSLTSTSVTLEWNSVSGVSGYEVEIEDGDNTPAFERNYTVSSTSKSVTGLSAGGEYKFKVKSKCSSSSSDYSGWYFFVTPGNNGGNGGDDGNNGGGSCDIPTGLMVSNVTSTSATLSWNAASGAVSYEVEVEDGDNTPFFNQEVVVTGTSYEVTGLSAGGEYKFKVKSECGSGSSDYAAWVFFNTSGSGSGGNGGDDGNNGGGSCDIPTGLMVSNVTSTSATLSWNAASGAVSYEVEVEDGDNTPFFNQEVVVTGTSYEVTGLSAGGEYKFKVKSECGSGSSDHAAWVFFNTSGSGNGGNGGDDGNNGGGSCDIPTGLMVSNVTSTSATLSWNAAAGAVSYEVEVEDGDNTPFFNQEVVVTGTSYEVTGLSAGGEYKFKVKSECGSGSSDHAAWVFFNTNGNGDGGNNGGNTGDCAIPEGLSVSNFTGTGVTLSWSAAPGAVGYEVELEDGENTPLLEIKRNTTASSISVEGLLEGGQYKFKVKSICTAGSTDYSPWFFFLATETGIQDANNGGNDGLACTTPTGLLATNLASGGVLLSWEDQPGAISYELEIESEETTPFFVRNIMTAESSYEITGLVEGGLYKFKVKSQCASGSSDHAPAVFFTVGGDAGNGGNNANCSIPQQLSVEEVTTNSALLSWQPVEGAIAYELEVEDDEATPFFSVNTEVIGTSYRVTGLSEGGNYKFKVKSICSTGSSDHAPDHFFTTLTNDISGQIAGVTVFPNPASDFVRIDLTHGSRSGQVQLQLVSITGRIVWDRRIDTNDTQSLDVTLGQFTPGLYQLNVISKDGMTGKKVMINR